MVNEFDFSPDSTLERLIERELQTHDLLTNDFAYDHESAILIRLLRKINK